MKVEKISLNSYGNPTKAKASGGVKSVNNGAVNTPNFSGNIVQGDLVKDIQKLMPSTIKVTNRLADSMGEIQNILINAVGTGLVAPIFIKYNPLSKTDEDTAITDIYERITPAIVVVDAELKDGTSSGTGCIIDSKGVILTSSHVIANASDIQITISSGEVYKGETLSVLGKDNDLALIKINPKRELPTLKLGDSAKVKVGQRVLAIGNPFGFNGTLTTGIISRIDYTRNKLQTDAAINPGNSGGPIVNIKGEVIGISQSIYNPDNNVSNIGIGFAVPINEAKSFIKLTLSDSFLSKSMNVKEQ